ncbi:MAG TPA: Ig-like domain-containing protein, partial [Gaiellaceae bacterium]|nr:Ig-like domain-containing protein [Gaiellaceae bacterium]
MTNSTNAGTHPLTFSLRRLGLIGSVAFFALFVFLWSAAPAQAQLRAMGPTHPDPDVAPYPFWYEDVNGVRLQLCVSDAAGAPAFCGNTAADLNVESGVPPEPDAGGEGFWWMAVADTAFQPTFGVGNGVTDILYEAAIEASTFPPTRPTSATSTGASVFSRMRVRISTTIGGTYVLVHPFGTHTYTNVGTGTRAINDTVDFGCRAIDFVPPESCFDGVAPDFDAVLSDPGVTIAEPRAPVSGTCTCRPIDTFLKWDPAVNPQAPPGFLGDGGLGIGTPHEVVGAPVNNADGLPQNYVELYRLNAAGERELVARTDLFQIEGWLTAGPTQPDLTAASDSGASQVDNITFDTTPTFSGSASAGATVNIYDGTTPLGSTIAAPGTGLYSFTAGALAEGPHAISATEQTLLDPLTESEHSASLNMTVDVTAPAAPALPDLLAASDSGSSSTDNITNDTTPTFAGNAAANMTVNILVDGISRGSGAASAAGSYSITT